MKECAGVGLLKDLLEARRSPAQAPTHTWAQGRPGSPAGCTPASTSESPASTSRPHGGCLWLTRAGPKHRVKQMSGGVEVGVGRPPRLCYPGGPGFFPATTAPRGQRCPMLAPCLGGTAQSPGWGVICAFLARSLLHKSGLSALTALPAFPRNQRQVLGRWTPQRAAPAPARAQAAPLWGLGVPLTPENRREVLKNLSRYSHSWNTRQPLTPTPRADETCGWQGCLGPLGGMCPDTGQGSRLWGRTTARHPWNLRPCLCEPQCSCL